MKRVNLTTVDRPQVDADCAGHVAQSTVIVNAKKNPNFANPVAYFDVVNFIIGQFFYFLLILLIIFITCFTVQQFCNHLILATRSDINLRGGVSSL